MTLLEHLHRHRETLPTWLEEFTAAHPFSYESFFGSRVVYYPGSGSDGHPVQLFGSTHSAHTFVYVDYGMSLARLEEELDSPGRGFRGYRTLLRRRLGPSDLTFDGWTPHVSREDLASSRSRMGGMNQPYGVLEILERTEEKDDSHGASRLAVLFLGADGIATYDALFCQDSSVAAPFALVLQDHGFGGNYDRFGNGGLLERLATRCRVFPDWLLVAEGTRPWTGFERFGGVEGDRGGMHQELRYLYSRST
jgi:hypothetical protein